MFVDIAIVTFSAGKGGNGCLSFRREKFIPKGGPDGGNGGDGASIILKSDSSVSSLVDFRFHPLVKAENGGNGSGSLRTGASGKSHVILVPSGTIIKTYPENKLIFDFSSEGMSFVIAKGGKGGRGNNCFKSSVNRAPRRVEKGQKGETIKVILELKLIAYAGLVGLPNSGKSTLISQISNSRPKIGDYPFTTLFPNLGVVYDHDQSLVLADIPGIIEGAHQGKGMGLEFLRHIERTKILIYLVDLSPYAPEDPLTAFQILRNELQKYQSLLLQKEFLVVGNKIDLLESQDDRSRQLKKYCEKEHLPYLEISALKKTNLKAFKEHLFKSSHG